MTTLQGYAGSNNHHVNTILVVDDVPENLRLLEDLLSGQGYKINATTSGHLAVQSILCNPPDLILLDIIMPEIDGFAVCKKIKGHEKSKDIPIIFISALDQPEDKVKAFNSGGVDYITKPFQAEEVIARVNTHLSIRNCYKKLERQNIELAETARLKEEVDHLMQHDLKNPLTPILSFPKLIRNNRHLTEKQSKYLNQIEQSGYRILDMINRSTDLIKMERGIYQLKPVPVDIMQVLERACGELESVMKTKHLSAEIMLNKQPISDKDSFFIFGEEFLCMSMLGNLMKNAVEASKEGDTIKIELDNLSTSEIRINNRGTVPEQIRERFFEKYITADKDRGTGLGTYTAKLTAETQGGGISFETSESNGTTVKITFPSS